MGQGATPGEGLVEADERKLGDASSFLAQVLSGKRADWPFGRDPGATAKLIADIHYHGISGFLAERQVHLDGWPETVRKSIRDLALSRAMWEVRHRAILGPLLERLGAAGVSAILLKGTALAYDLYSNPALRERGDTDLLVTPADRARVRQLLAAAGFVPHRYDTLPEDLRTQESWTRRVGEEGDHAIDLHWQVINFPAFDRDLAIADVAQGARPLPHLDPAAHAPSRPFLLVHACLHREAHQLAPYFVGGKTYYGGDRLIWLKDISLLSAALSDEEWEEFSGFTEARGWGAPCLEGLDSAHQRFGGEVPENVRAMLGNRGPVRQFYFDSGAVRRALRDVRAISGSGRKWRYVSARLFPGAGFLRGKYPDLAGQPLARLYLRRVADFLRPSRRAGRR